MLKGDPEKAKRSSIRRAARVAERHRERSKRNVDHYVSIDPETQEHSIVYRMTKEDGTHVEFRCYSGKGGKRK